MSDPKNGVAIYAVRLPRGQYTYIASDVLPSELAKVGGGIRDVLGAANTLNQRPTITAFEAAAEGVPDTDVDRLIYVTHNGLTPRNAGAYQDAIDTIIDTALTNSLGDIGQQLGLNTDRIELIHTMRNNPGMLPSQHAQILYAADGTPFAVSEHTVSAIDAHARAEHGSFMGRINTRYASDGKVSVQDIVQGVQNAQDAGFSTVSFEANAAVQDKAGNALKHAAAEPAQEAPQVDEPRHGGIKPLPSMKGSRPQPVAPPQARIQDMQAASQLFEIAEAALANDMTVLDTAHRFEQMNTLNPHVQRLVADLQTYQAENPQIFTGFNRAILDVTREARANLNDLRNDPLATQSKQAMKQASDAIGAQFMESVQNLDVRAQTFARQQDGQSRERGA